MASLIVIIIILGCVAYQFFKGTFVKSFAMVITATCASIIAFGYFESLANLLIHRNITTLWAQSLSFGLLFVLTFAILQIIVILLTVWPVNLGLTVERVGRTVFAIISGIILAGALLTILALAPLSNKNPYQRFNQANPDAEKPNRALLNADGLTAGWFSIISSGSLSGKNSFAAVHPNFLDQVFLNRLTDGISVLTRSDAIAVPEKAAWPAPKDLKDSNGNPISPKSGCNLTIVRIGIKKSTVDSAGIFTPSQLRLICKPKSYTEDLLSGKGKNIYPIGYLRRTNQLQTKQLSDPIRVETADCTGPVKWLDFVFNLPDDSVPVLVEFKQNIIAPVPQPVTSEQAPLPAPFIAQSECATAVAQLTPLESAKIYGVELAAGTDFLSGITLDLRDPNQWQSVQTANSIKPAQFEDEKVSHVRAEMKIDEAAKKTLEETKPAPRQTQRQRARFVPRTQQVRKLEGIAGLLSPLAGYKLLSLKCNNPNTGEAIKADQLPVLVELSGSTHHPVGVIASGKIGDQIVYEVDYCSLPAKDNTGCLVINKDGAVSQSFPDSIWLTEQAQSISEFYLLYLVKTGANAIIISVKPADSQTAAGFKKYEGFSVD